MFLPGESQGRQSLVGCSPWGRKELDTNHNADITHQEPDILEYEVKWDLGSITMNTASGGDDIPDDLLQILKDDAVKVLNSITSTSSVCSDAS